MNHDKTNNVANIGQNAPEAPARQVTGMTDMHVDVPARQFELSDQSRHLLKGLGVAGLAAAVAWVAAPRPHHEPAPTPETFTQKVVNSAQVPYDPATDTLVIGNMRVTNNSETNTPSEAVLGNSKVKAFVAAHPNESSSVTTSAMSLPTAEDYVLVRRDVDHDGDLDAVAVPQSK